MVRTLDVQSRKLLGRIKLESPGFFCPGSADELVGCEAAKGLQPFGEAVGVDEVAERGGVMGPETGVNCPVAEFCLSSIWVK